MQNRIQSCDEIWFGFRVSVKLKAHMLQCLERDKTPRLPVGERSLKIGRLLVVVIEG